MLKRKYKKAFSLIELSIVLVIISILIAGSLSVSTAGINNARIKVTNDRIQAIYKALGNYLRVNYKLPCPASIYKVKTSSDYGEAVGTDASCDTGNILSNLQSNVVYGAVPVNTIGLSDDVAEDGFGNKLVYIVNKRFTVAEYPNTSNLSGFSFYAANGNDTISVVDVSSGNGVDNNIFAIISLGSNRYGAFGANSNTQISGSSDTYEAKNYPINITDAVTFKNADFGLNSDYNSARVVLSGSSSASSVFDDILFFKTRAQVLEDFNLQFLLPCATQSINSRTYNATYYGMLRYGSSACSSPSTTTPTYRCGPNSTWIMVDGCLVY